jgi:hypothetical protein
VLTDPEAARHDRQGPEECLAASASDLAQVFESVLSPVDAAVLQGEGGMAASDGLCHS